MSLQSAIREIQRSQSAISAEIQLTATAAQAVETAGMGHARVLSEIGKSATGGFDTSAVQQLRSMEKLVLPASQLNDIVTRATRLLETYKSIQPQIPSYVDEAVRSVQKFNQLIGQVQAAVGGIARHGEQFRSIIEESQRSLASVNWSSVKDRLEELGSGGAAEIEAEIREATEEYCDEFVAELSGDDSAFTFGETRQSEIDDSRCDDSDEQQVATERRAMERRDALRFTIMAMLSMSSLGVQVYNTFYHDGTEQSSPASNTVADTPEIEEMNSKKPEEDGGETP